MKILKIAAALAAFCAIQAAAPGRFALADGAATQFEGQLLGVMIETAGGQWITVWEGDEPVNFLDSKNPCITLPSKGKIPPGKYINLKLRFSEFFTVSGSDGAYMTRAGSSVVIGGTAPTMDRLPGEILSYEETHGPSWNTQEAGEMKIHLNYDYQDKDDYIEMYRRREFQDPIVVTEKSVIKIWVSLSLSSSLQLAMPGTLALRIPKEKALVFILPQKISEMIVRVDTSTIFVKGSEMVVEL